VNARVEIIIARLAIVIRELDRMSLRDLAHLISRRCFQSSAILVQSGDAGCRELSGAPPTVAGCETGELRRGASSIHANSLPSSIGDAEFLGLGVSAVSPKF
jgi:hypothetical protein